MNTDEARIVLGPLAEELSDSVIAKDIEVAELFVNLFFNVYLKRGKQIVSSEMKKV